MLPEQATSGTKSEREQMINNYKSGNNKRTDNSRLKFETVDNKNGYLKVDALDGRWEMCYWNLPDEKLVAVYQEACGPSCYVEHFDFFKLTGGKLVLQNIDSIIPGYSSLQKDFYKKNATDVEKERKEKDVYVTVLFRIPTTGKDILAVLDIEENINNKPMSAFSKGNRMVLKWSNGKFAKDKIFTVKN